MPASPKVVRALLARVVQTYCGAVGSLIAGRREEAETRQAELAAGDGRSPPDQTNNVVPWLVPLHPPGRITQRVSPSQ